MVIFQTPLSDYDWIDVSAYCVGIFSIVLFFGFFFFAKPLLATWIGYALLAGLCYFLGYVATCKVLGLD
jgi:drug/metabolite transporter (DMT)-like permease